MRATIDIGTNSVLLLIARFGRDGVVHVVKDCAEVTRLGEGLAKNGVISDEAAERTIRALGRYWKECVKYKAKSIRVIGTEALRTAKNADDFLLVVKRGLHLDIEVISAEREAELTYKAQVHDFGAGLTAIDIGGGSTEFINPQKMVSLPIGSVVLTEEFLQSDPPSDRELKQLRRHIQKVIDGPSRFYRKHSATCKLVATAGTATTIMAIKLGLEPYKAETAHGQALSIERLDSIICKLKAKTIEERKKIKGLDPKRADVIIAGAILLEEIMKATGFSRAIISDRGTKWGLFYEEFCQRH